jgi:glycosyltransferase involved in cell wall biosynthesis
VRRGNEGFRFLIVGEGAERPWLERQMPEAEFTGVLTRQALSRAFANMDLFVFSSEMDRFGRVVLEALASFVPAVVTASGGTSTHCRTNGPDLLPAASTSLWRLPNGFSTIKSWPRPWARLTASTLKPARSKFSRTCIALTSDVFSHAPSEVAQGVFDAHERVWRPPAAGLTGLPGCGTLSARGKFHEAGGL